MVCDHPVDAEHQQRDQHHRLQRQHAFSDASRMTTYVADIASYQKGLTPSALLAAGFTGVNVKVSHGMGQKSVAPDAHDWLADKRFTHSTFHYLTGEASGAAQ